uniref:Uncharacterized protein n=1 Tax=Rhizophora mucronata TaxID=61149 RepID=A0A2P2N120_RHIMU
MKIGGTTTTFDFQNYQLEIEHKCPSIHAQIKMHLRCAGTHSLRICVLIELSSM